MQSPYLSFYNRLPIKKELHRDELFLFTKKEVKEVRRIEQKAILIAAFVGAMGVVFLYLPQYFWPRLFPDQQLHLFGKSIAVPLLFLVYGGLLAVLEIFVLILLNIFFVHETSVATGFLHKQNKAESATQNLVLNIAKSKTTKAEAKYGINPFLGLNEQTIFTIVLLQKVKGMLSNALVKALAGRLGGRFMIQIVKNMLSIPVYGFWDGWATRAVLRKARSVIMGQNLINHLFDNLPPVSNDSQEFKALLYDSLQYVATSKRYFHDNHNLLTERVFERYSLDKTAQFESQKNFIQRLKVMPDAEKGICGMVMLTGFLLDERIPAREQLHIHQLYKAGIIPYNVPAVWAAHHKFMKGEPVIDFIKLIVKEEAIHLGNCQIMLEVT